MCPESCEPTEHGARRIRRSLHVAKQDWAKATSMLTDRPTVSDSDRLVSLQDRLVGSSKIVASALPRAVGRRRRVVDTPDLGRRIRESACSATARVAGSVVYPSAAEASVDVAQ